MRRGARLAALLVAAALATAAGTGLRAEDAGEPLDARLYSQASAALAAGRRDEAMRLLSRVGTERRVVGCDVVEFAPLGGLHHADLTAAKLVSKMINYFVP